MAFGFFDSTNDPANPDGYSAIERKRRLAEAMMAQGMSGKPIKHWTEGLANVVKTAVGSYQSSKLDDEEKSSNDAFRTILLNAISGGGASSSPSAPAPVQMASDGQPAPVPPANVPQGAPAPSPGKDAFVAQMMPHALEVSKQTGLDPRVVIAQAALETGYGKSAPGNNFFGIKSHGAPGGNTMATTEVVNGQPVRINDSFRAYADMGESAKGYAEFLRKNPRYAPMLQAQGLDAQIAALAKSGYATDPAYGAKIASIARSLPNPGDLPSPGAQEVGGAPLPPGAEAFAGGSQSGLTPEALRAFAQRSGMLPADPTGGASLSAGDLPSPNATPAGPAPMPEDPILAATRQRAQTPQPGDQTLPLGSAQEQAFTRLEGQPGPAAPQGQAAPSGADRSKMLLVAALDPRLSPQQRQMALQVYSMTQKDENATFGEIGVDPVTGAKQMGWINPRKQTVTPINQQQGGGGSAYRQNPDGSVTLFGQNKQEFTFPPGTDLKTAREMITKRETEGLLGAKPEEVSSLRKEVQNLPSYKNVAQAAPIFQAMSKAANTDSRAADLDLVYGLGKIMDPNSVVREGEMVMVSNTASIPQWLKGQIDGLNGGARLTPETRVQILKQAHNRVQAYAGEYQNDTEHYRGIAKRNKMNEDDVIRPFGPFNPWAPAAPDTSAVDAARGSPAPASPPAATPPGAITPEAAAAELERRRRQRGQ